MKYLYSTFTLLMSFSFFAYAVEPLSENDMSDLALDSGSGLLQIYGPTAAGLRVEALGKNEEPPENESTDDTSIKSAESTIKSLEDQLTEEFQRERPDLEFDPNLQAIVKPNERVVGDAASFDTLSQIQYNKSNFKHEATFNSDGSVQHDRDLQIDLLKFENIGGDDLNDPSTIGSIYISDWTSQGSTTTQVR
ncbi:MAG: hypothetical protein MK096_04100 [Oleiphilaceae bacterium]|uniref:hypothetical protein n=1 Tax=Oleiphilus sp. HI0125 TaxID=1822266 RepID=UPI0007C236A5|nr:hypothetical protein [Oleiphilus sp. HI0125]KZZ58406.1 hypothetical protein A3762_18265 [Oleiphilus sp. HI0125]KZZ63411.1 hypothetical protein A3762_01710 [Oleiphilus sp. HI0125]MCH2157939.1 hypothetical protein [Oleiphilaceae bacterium]